MAHFRNCMEVAACAAAEKRRYTLAITYDELCRKHWSQKALAKSLTTQDALMQQLEEMAKTAKSAPLAKMQGT